MNRTIAIVVLCISGAVQALAQQSGPQMAEAMRQEGKIYVVVAVIAVIFLCLAAFLVYLERRLGRLEKRLHNQQSANSQ